MRILVHAPMHYEYSTELASALAARSDVSAVLLVVCADFPYEQQCDCAIERLYPDQSRVPGKMAKLRAHFGALARLIALLRRWRPDILHIQALRHTDIDWPLLLAARLLSVPIVWTAHNALPHERRAHHRLLYRTIYGGSDRLIVHTRHTQAELERFGVPGERMARVPHGNLRRMVGRQWPKAQARCDLGLETGDQTLVLLFFGRVRPYKGLDLLLAAMARLEQRDIVLLVAGEDLFDEWSTVVAPANVRMDLRRIDNDSADRYFSAADLVVLPYRRIDQSGVLMLAMSHGVPVMATAVGGLAEVIEHGRTGFLLPPEDIEALTSAIGRIDDDRDGLARVRQATRDAVDNEYGWATIAAQTMAVYGAVARKR
ncbi:glycosyltransferase family 4 protein [Salinisphaera sp. T31B1]|uniref:glycosyltransferase family 4 protein n=1 Tax=Salinisphaera sp. T31B1 TaxID=727963 RepID=UPI00334212CF